MIKKFLKWIGISLGSILALFLVTIIVLSQLEKTIYKEFYHDAGVSISIPGLNDKFIPQGLSYAEEEKVFLSSGYMHDGKASRIYISTPAGSKYVEILNEDGSDFLGHCGGISVVGSRVFLASDDYLYEVSLEDVLSLKKVQIVNKHLLDLVPAFTFTKDDTLFVGEFYKKVKYETNPAHHIQVEENEMNHAFCYAYQVEEDTAIDFNNPLYVYSLPDMVQGMCINQDLKVAVSTSWGISSSHICIYNLNNTVPMKYIFNEKEIPLYKLSGSNLEKSLDLPPMSEELEYINNKIYINFESAGAKYKNVNLYRQKNVLTYPF